MECNTRTDAQGVRLIHLTEVIRFTGRGRSRIYSEIKAGRFPRPVHDGASSRWVESEILAWIATRIAERDARAAA